jgi:hypothetical protein
MGVVSSPFRVTARVPGVMKEIGIEHVQHFVDEGACPEAFGGKSRRCWGRPKRCAQIHDVRLRSLIGDRHITRAQGTEIAAKGNAPSSSQFSCDCPEPVGDGVAGGHVASPWNWRRWVVTEQKRK